MRHCVVPPMPSRADVEALAQAGRDIRRLALRDLQGWWATLDMSNPARVRAEMEAFLPILVREYGDVAMTVAADFYDEQRAQSKVKGRFTADTPPPLPDAQITASGRWGIGPLFGDLPDEQAALNRLGMVVDRLALQYGRSVIHRSAVLDPARARVARVPAGAETCAFCLMLASRGPVYHSEESAGRARRYHGMCDCQPIPVWDGDTLPEGYAPEDLYAKYEAARRQASGGDTTAILSALRETEGTH